ncbi:hypothetical protein H7X69_01705, partial [Candidatus Saccharibacteria bacterium]|nr:hypothetical protein [Candidatus Saccharibacteria bacterium]
GSSSFLDDWLAKRQQIAATPAQSPPRTTPAPDVLQTTASDTRRSDEALSARSNMTNVKKPALPDQAQATGSSDTFRSPASSDDKFHVRGKQAQDDEGVSIKLR